MKKQETLSDKIVGERFLDKFGNDVNGGLFIPEQDVKEFIKRLKEIFPKRRIQILGRTIHKEIDKLAGAKLK